MNGPIQSKLKTLPMASRRRPSLEDWFSAAINHDYLNVNEWISTMAGSADENKETALMKAVRAQDPQMVHILAKHEAGATNDKGYTALIIAAINNLGSLCTILAPLESDVTLFGGRTALMMAASVSACSSIEALIPIQHGRRDDSGMTALMYAVTYGNVDAASALVDYERRILSSENKSALVIAAEHYRKDMVRLLYPHECGLLPDAEQIVLAPYNVIRDNSRYPTSFIEYSSCSDTEARSCDQQRSKSASCHRQPRSATLVSAPYTAQGALPRYLLGRYERKASLDLSWSESCTPHKIRSVRINFSPRRVEKQLHFDSPQPRQQRAKSASAHERSNNILLAQQYPNAPHYETSRLHQERTSKKASPRLRTKTLTKADRYAVIKQQLGVRQKPSRSRHFSEDTSEHYASEQSSKRSRNTIQCHSLANGPYAELKKRAVFTPTPTPEPTKAENGILLALRRHILKLERELSEKESELQALVGLNESSQKTILALQEQARSPSAYDATPTQCATQTEMAEEYKVSHSVQSPLPSYNTHSSTMKKLQEDAYLKQLCASLSLIKEDILLLCTTAQQEYISQEHSTVELSKHPGSLDHELEDDTFAVLVPCNHLVDLEYFATKGQGEESRSIAECPRCGTRPTSIITVKM